MPDLSDDERAVLMIAAQGQSMLAIGRWQKPVENLTVLGLLKRLDAFNFVITDNGKKILAERQDDENTDFRNALAAVNSAQQSRDHAVQSGNQSAYHLSMAAKAAAKISGLTPEQECWSIGQGIIQRALELLK